MTRGRKGTGTPTHVAPHARISFGGTLGTPGDEIWECSLNWAGATDALTAQVAGFTPDLYAQELPNLQTLITNWFTSADYTAGGAGGMAIAFYAALDYVKLNWIGADDAYAHAPNTLQFTPVFGANHGDPTHGFPLPYNVTTGLTFRVLGRRTGRGSKGRMFPPVAGYASGGADGYSIPAVCQAQATATATLISAINASLFHNSATIPGTDPGAGNICVVSRQPVKGPNAGAAPFNSPITSVAVNGVLDVMTSRVDKLKRREVSTGVTNVTNPPAA